MLALLSPAFAAGLALQLDGAEISAGQTVGLTLQVVDAAVGRPPSIAAPAGVTVRFVTQARSRQMINFDVSETQTFRYEVSAAAPGDFMLGPLELKTTAGVLRAEPVTLHVSARDTSTLDALVAELPSERAWVGQVVVVHLEFKTRRNVVNVRWAPPEDARFTAEPGVEPLTNEYRVGTGSGASSVAELWYPMRARGAGDQPLGGSALLGQFAVQRRRGSTDPFLRDLPGFTDVENDTLVSNTLPLKVRELPAGGRPADFSGLVGTFTLTAKASAQTVKVGDTVTVDLTLEGDGSVAGITLPAWSGEGFRVYDDTPAVNASIVDGRYHAVATFKRAVVPERPGPLTIPGIRLTWFDPATGAYVERTLEPIQLDVVGTAQTAAVEGFTERTEVRSGVGNLNEDILPVRTDVSLGAPWPAGLGWLLCLPGAGLLAAELAPRLRRRSGGPAAEARYGFADLPSDPEGRLAGVERIFREEAGRRLGRPAPELKREDVATLGAEADALYRELDLARYRGGAGLPEARVRAWVEGK